MLTREELQKTYSESYNLPEEQIDRMVDVQIESLYGTHEEYEQKLEKHMESESNQFKPEYDEVAYQAFQDELAEEDNQIKRPEALDYYLKQKARAINAGVPEAHAEAQARHAALVEFGDAAFQELDSDSLDSEVNRLVERGIELAPDEKRLIKSIMRTSGVTVVEAMRQVAIDQQKSRNKLEGEIKAAGGREREYYEALSPSDKRTLQSLKGFQPEANWTARKLFKTFNYKPLPRKAAPPKEETVPRAEYEAERDKIMELLTKIADFN